MRNRDAPLVSDAEWRVLVDLHLDFDRRQLCYEAGYADGQREALQEVSQILSATANATPSHETRQIVTNLASITALMASDGHEGRTSIRRLS